MSKPRIHIARRSSTLNNHHESGLNQQTSSKELKQSGGLFLTESWSWQADTGLSSQVEVPNYPSINITGSAITIEFWIYLKNLYDPSNVSICFVNKENHYELV